MRLTAGNRTLRSVVAVTCGTDASQLPGALPPVVVAPPNATAGPLGDRTAGWEPHRVTLRQRGQPAVILVDPRRSDAGTGHDLGRTGRGLAPARPQPAAPERVPKR